MISVSTAGAAGTLRVQVWRKLRSLGALYLQQSVCLLPARGEVVRDLRRLADRIHHQGGTARILRDASPIPPRNTPWSRSSTRPATPSTPKLSSGCPRCAKELAEETARGQLTYAEVEESEADLDRFGTWLAKIAARDYFVPPAVRPPARPWRMRRPSWPLSRTPRCMPTHPTPTGAVNTQQLRIVDKS